jgi:hypothetical protein
MPEVVDDFAIPPPRLTHELARATRRDAVADGFQAATQPTQRVDVELSRK